MRVGPVAPRTRDCGDCRSWRRGRIKNNAHRARLLARPTYADAFSHRPLSTRFARRHPFSGVRLERDATRFPSLTQRRWIRVAQPYRYERSVRAYVVVMTSYAVDAVLNQSIDRVCARSKTLHAVTVARQHNNIMYYAVRAKKKNK